MVVRVCVSTDREWEVPFVTRLLPGALWCPRRWGKHIVWLTVGSSACVARPLLRASTCTCTSTCTGRRTGTGTSTRTRTSTSTRTRTSPSSGSAGTRCGRILGGCNFSIQPKHLAQLFVQGP